MQKCKVEDERKQTLNTKIYPVVSVATKTLLVYVIEALNKSIVFRLSNFLIAILTCHQVLLSTKEFFYEGCESPPALHACHLCV